MIVSGLALKVHYDDPGKEPCSINDKWDCGTVNHSEYAVIHGIPVAALGIVGYLLIAVLGYLREKELLLIVILLALPITVHLTDIEKYVLQIWCLYCVISQGILAILALFSIGWILISRFRLRPAY
jgi:uncharacterized membrane protein